MVAQSYRLRDAVHHPTTPEVGESLTRILGDWIVPQDTNGDVITAIS